MQHVADSNIRENLRALLQPSIYRIVSHLQQQNCRSELTRYISAEGWYRDLREPGEEVKMRRVHSLYVQSCCQAWVVKVQVS